jgi:DNA mismatch repair ATPase MutS
MVFFNLRKNLTSIFFHKILNRLLDVDEINERLKIVESLINDRPYLSMLSSVIKQFNNLDELVTFCHQLSRNDNLDLTKSMQRKIINLILMQKMINLTPFLKEVIQQQIKNIPLFQSYYDVNFHCILEF